MRPSWSNYLLFIERFEVSRDVWLQVEVLEVWYYISWNLVCKYLVTTVLGVFPDCLHAFPFHVAVRCTLAV